MAFQETFDEILLDVRDGVAVITLNRPERLNAYTPTMGRELAGPTIGESRIGEHIARFLANVGADCVRQEAAPGRDNIVARLAWPGSGPMVLLEAHQDTVPVDGMTVPPFDGDVRDGKLFGRGACDVKGGIAAILATMERLAAERPRGAASVMAAFTVDEEFTFTGARRLAQDLKGITMAIVAEPTRLEVVVAHKGLVRWKVRTIGRSCHSARPEDGENAIYRMAPVIEALERYARGPVAGRTHGMLGPATLSVGVIRGGTSVNTVPGSCEVEVDRRLLPGEDPAEAIEHCRRRLDAEVHGGYLFDPPWVSDPALETPTSSPVVRLAEAAVREVTGRCLVRGVPYGTDAARISLAGVPTVVLGPGDIAQAHTVDEWIDLDEIERAAEVYYRFVLAAGA